MPINFGSSGIGEIYYGSTPIKEVYSGGTLVWSSGPSWPITGEWSGTINGEAVEIHQWVVPETGEWTVGVNASSANAQTLQVAIMRNHPTDGDYLAGEMRLDPGTVAGTYTGTLQAGDTIYWRVLNYPSGHVTANWSVELLPPP